MRGPHLLLTGDFWHAEFRGLVQDLRLPVTLVGLDQVEAQLADLDEVSALVVAESRRGQIPRATLVAIRDRHPLLPMVLLLGSWCEGETRSGDPVPGVARVYWHQWRGEFRWFLDQLAAGRVAGWFQGRMEFGPRALGNRGILADPRDPAMQKKLNLRIKFREGFRPFAPSVTEEKAREWFDLDAPSPYMLLTAPVREGHRRPLPDGYAALPLWEKLYTERSDIPAVTHVDLSARIQTVRRESNPRYHALLEAFERETGCPVLVNTSFNVRGEPIVNSPEDAYRCFMATDMDLLVLGDFVYVKDEQPHAGDHAKWTRSFGED